jgi:hypothetical protein
LQSTIFCGLIVTGLSEQILTCIRIDLCWLECGASKEKISVEIKVDMHALTRNASTGPQRGKRGLWLARRTATSRLICSCQPWMVAAVVLAGVALRGESVSWVGGSGDWSTATNWRSNQVPTASDDAFITNAGNYTVTISANAFAGTITFRVANGTQTLELSPCFDVDWLECPCLKCHIHNEGGHPEGCRGYMNGTSTFNWGRSTMLGSGRTNIRPTRLPPIVPLDYEYFNYISQQN